MMRGCDLVTIAVVPLVGHTFLRRFKSLPKRKTALKVTSTPPTALKKLSAPPGKPTNFCMASGEWDEKGAAKQNIPKSKTSQTHLLSMKQVRAGLRNRF